MSYLCLCTGTRYKYIACGRVDYFEGVICLGETKITFAFKKINNSHFRIYIYIYHDSLNCHVICCIQLLCKSHLILGLCQMATLWLKHSSKMDSAKRALHIYWAHLFSDALCTSFGNAWHLIKSESQSALHTIQHRAVCWRRPPSVWGCRLRTWDI